MAERKSQGAKRRRKPAAKAPRVIDVEASNGAAKRSEIDGEHDPSERGSEPRGESDGEAGSERDAEHEDHDSDGEPQDSDAELASSSATVEPDEVLDDDAEEAVPVERGSLARRDPMSVYLR